MDMLMILMMMRETVQNSKQDYARQDPLHPRGLEEGYLYFMTLQTYLLDHAGNWTQH
jgi:hypothetical protein